jgi:hypothetical protein
LIAPPVQTFSNCLSPLSTLNLPASPSSLPDYPSKMPGSSEPLTAMTLNPLKNGLFLTLQMRPFLSTASKPLSSLAHL